MDKRVASLIGLGALVAFAAVLVPWRTGPPPPLASSTPDAHPSSPAVVAHPVVEPKPLPPATVAADVPVLAPATPTASAVEVPVAPAKPGLPPVPPPPPVSEPERAVVGESPYPVGGKPVGPFDIAWSFQVGVAHAHGTIRVRHLSPTALVIVEVVPRDGARLERPFRAQVEIGKDGMQEFPLEVMLGPGTNTLVVTVTAIGADRRARVVSIPLIPVAPAPVPQASAPGAAPTGKTTVPSAPLSGSHVIRDERGEVIQLDPSSPAGK